MGADHSGLSLNDNRTILEGAIPARFSRCWFSWRSTSWTAPDSPRYPASGSRGVKSGRISARGAGKRAPPIRILECGEEMVDFLALCPDLLLDRPRFQYRRETLLRRTVAEKLCAAERLLPEGYRFLVIEGWRPPHIQQENVPGCLGHDRAAPSRRVRGCAQADRQPLQRPDERPRSPTPHHRRSRRPHARRFRRVGA